MPVRNHACQELYITVNTLNVYVHIIVHAVPVQAFVYVYTSVNILCVLLCELLLLRCMFNVLCLCSCHLLNFCVD